MVLFDSALSQTMCGQFDLALLRTVVGLSQTMYDIRNFYATANNLFKYTNFLFGNFILFHYFSMLSKQINSLSVSQLRLNFEYFTNKVIEP